MPIKTDADSCATCGRARPGRYCTNCGERRPQAGEHTLRRWIEQLVEAFTNTDGKVVATLRQLLTRPGQLTADYLRGRRKPYMPALQLFLLTNLGFFLLHPLVGSNVLTTDLHTHVQYAWHAPLARAWVEERLNARQMTMEVYAAQFDPAAVTQARSLVILLVPVFSLAVLLFFGRPRREYAAYLVFSFHFCSFWLWLICATLGLTNLTVHLLRLAGVFPSDAIVSGGIVVVTLAVMTPYLFRASRAVFARESGWITAAKALALGIALLLSLQAYRCALFFITFWTT